MTLTCKIHISLIFYNGGAIFHSVSKSGMFLMSMGVRMVGVRQHTVAVRHIMTYYLKALVTFSFQITVFKYEIRMSINMI